MDQVLVHGIEKWLKKFPWLWAIRKSWVDVRIRAKRVDTATELVQVLSVGNIILYVEVPEVGPFVLLPKKELAGKPIVTKESLFFLRHEIQGQLRFIAVEIGKEITIYKPPRNGWSLKLFDEAWVLADANLRSRAASP